MSRAENDERAIREGLEILAGSAEHEDDGPHARDCTCGKVRG